LKQNNKLRFSFELDTYCLTLLRFVVRWWTNCLRNNPSAKHFGKWILLSVSSVNYCILYIYLWCDL